MMAADKLEQLYEHYNKLDSAKENIKQFQSSYLAILGAVHGSPQEKQLCSQFISKFFVHFPDYYEAAIDSLLDLCEDDDPNIRRRAIKELPNICRDRKEFVPKIADVLAQLLLSEDQIELNIVNQALLTLANHDLKSFLLALFGQILEGEEETRDRVIKFLSTRLRSIKNELFTKEIEEFLLEECKKVLIDVTKEEFLTLMNLLSNLKISKTLTGHNTLLSIIKEQAELNNDFIPTDTDFLDKFLMCVRHGIPYFSQFSPSTDFVIYICTKILPHLGVLEAKQNGLELEFLQVLSEIIPFLSPMTEPKEIEKCQEVVFQCLLNYIPKPPEDIDSSANLSDDLPTTQFSHVECLLYCLHQLCKINPKFFTETKSEEFKDFKLRLQYLARGVQSYVNKLRKMISTLKENELKTPENKIKEVALKATTNINWLTQEFFQKPPSFKKTIQLSSFKQKKPGATNAPLLAPAVNVSPGGNSVTSTEQGTPPSAAKKRPLITAPEGSSPLVDNKRERKFYTPPAGKFTGGGFRRFSNDNRQNRNMRTPSTRGRGFRGRGGFRRF